MGDGVESEVFIMNSSKQLPRTGEIYKKCDGTNCFIIGTSINQSKKYFGETDIIFEDEEGIWHNINANEFFEIIIQNGEKQPRYAKQYGASWEK